MSKATEKDKEKEDMDNDDLFHHIEITVDKKQSPLRIDKFIISKSPASSRTKIQAAAKANKLFVNDKPVKSNYKIRPLDKISLTYPKSVNFPDMTPEDLSLDIVFEDNHLLIVNKPPGLVVHPGVGNINGTLVNGLLHHVNNLPGDNNERAGLVHRIDKNTSGLLVVAKTDEAMAHLAKQFFDRTINRKYLALVWGDVEEDEGRIEGNIGRDLKNPKINTVFPRGDMGKHAVTHYKVLDRFAYATLIECKLETGRTHQIRVHLKHIGHTLFNDEKYGGNRILKGTVYSKYKQFVDNCFQVCPRQALHAKSLGFIHPASGEELFFDSELPEDMQQAIDKWKTYSQDIFNKNME